ncbi:hypothetical protein Pla52o_33580 [Novipirellula galeiformis]|uniref:Uncharacterized protein n=1 Tax=Novipirellula galeiformis TaxID=2528004 RepID=A0A5C6CDY2_9BACT|nr:DUF6084 family protein [Novipirellula galeiformis]TWU22302.1 hypothetical protein Pla52o_33580 [Novipirellula galeiformis]
MLDLNFEILTAQPITFAAAPMIGFGLRVTHHDGEPAVQNISLQCQLQIETLQRLYKDDEKPGLLDLFGPPHRWSQTLKTMLWTHATVNVPPFTSRVEVTLPVTCTFDFNVAATKYFAAIDDGEIPLLFQFSGTIFYRGERGLQTTQISWDKEARYRMPIAVWKQMMEHYYPNSAWLCLQRDAFDSLQQYKRDHGIPTFEQALERLLETAAEGTTQ